MKHKKKERESRRNRPSSRVIADIAEIGRAKGLKSNRRHPHYQRKVFLVEVCL